MKNSIRFREPRALPVRLAASAIALAAALVGASAIAAGQGNAAPPAGGPTPQAKFKAPTLEDGLLTVKGTPASETIVLRLKAGDSSVLQVDVGGDGSADFSVARAGIAA